MLFASRSFRVYTVRVSVAVLVGFYSQYAAGGLCNARSTDGSRHEYQFLVGYSPASTTLVGTTENRRFLQAGFAYSYRCWKVGDLGVSPTATILPLAVVLQPDYQVAGRQIQAHSTFGLGLLPIGFTLDLKPTARVGVFGETHGGIIASAEPIPVDAVDATALNFIFDFGGGARWHLTDGYALRIGYRLVHISNGGRTPFNPGLDNNVLYAGFSILK